MADDYDSGQTIYLKFNTFNPLTGSPFTLVSGSVVAYKNALTSPVTSGIVLVSDFNNVLGLNHLTIDTSVNTSYYNNGSFFSLVLQSGFVNNISASGLFVESFGLRTNSSLKPVVSGQALMVNTLSEAWVSANSVSSGVWNAPQSTFNVNGTMGSGINKLSQDIYFANIKYVKDNVNNLDEFAGIWYKNGIPVPSSALSNPAISVYNTNTGANVITNQVMSFASPQLGSVRYNSSLLVASGEPYMISMSGSIDGATRTWNLMSGLDYL